MMLNPKFSAPGGSNPGYRLKFDPGRAKKKQSTHRKHAADGLKAFKLKSAGLSWDDILERMGKSRRSYLEKHIRLAAEGHGIAELEQWLTELEKPEHWERYCKRYSPEQVEKMRAFLEITAPLRKPQKVARNKP
jgi:hypothetical protein